MVINQIAELELDKELQVYRIHPGILMTFGEDVLLTRKLDELLVRHHEHQAIELITDNGERVQALGLISSKSFDPIYVELDDESEPILITEVEIKSIQLIDHFSQAKFTADSLKRLKEIVKCTLLECSIPLRIMIFRRLRIHILESLTDTVVDKQNEHLTILFKLLPWDDFNQHLQYLYKLHPFSNSHQESPPQLTKPLPDLSTNFWFVRPELAPALREITEWRPTDEPIKLYDVNRLINAIWDTDARRFPTETRGWLLKILDACNKFLDQYLRDLKNSNEISWTNTNVLKARAASVRTYLYCSRIREEGGTLKWLNRLSNLRGALIDADRAHFFDIRSTYFEFALWEEVDKTVCLLPTQPDALLADFSHSKTNISHMDELNLLVDAAVVLYFSAKIMTNFLGDQDGALSMLNSSDCYFKKSEQYLNLVPKRKRIVAQRWARALMLKAELLLYSGHKGEQYASLAFDEALQLLKNLTRSDYADKNSEYEEYGWRANNIYQANALIGKARIHPDDLETEKQINRVLSDLIIEDTTDTSPYKLLLDYYLNIKKNISIAIDHIDQWIKKLEDQKLSDTDKKQVINYLRYVAGNLCSMESKHDPSLALYAVKCFVDLLRDQPLNLVVTKQLIGFLDTLSLDHINEALNIIDGALPQLSSEDCYVTHAVIRLIEGLGNDSIEDITGPSIALAAIVKHRQDLRDKAFSVIKAYAQKNNSIIHFVLELLSKKYFERGRQIWGYHKQDFNIADSLLDLAIDIYGKDPILISRKLSIARFRASDSEIKKLIQQAERDFPNDPIIKIQIARLLISSKYFNEAQSVLLEAEALKREETNDDVHPAILDQLAYLAFRKGDLDYSEKLYNNILRKKPFDFRAYFGLGRVNFERGIAKWPQAFGEWLNAIRSQSKSLNYESDSTILWQNVCSLAKLCDAHHHVFSNQIRLELLHRLEETQRREDPVIAALIVDSLQSLGIVDQPVANAILNGASNTINRRLIRAIAQFLMASTVYNLLGANTDKVDISYFIKWCQDRGVLAEYLAGAKGSYGRALTRLWLRSSDINKELDQLRDSSVNITLGEHWHSLFEHINKLEYEPDYYSRAYMLVDKINTPSVKQLDKFVRYMISSIAHHRWEIVNSDKEALLDMLTPGANLCLLKDRLVLENQELSLVCGWVDADVLDVSEHIYGRGKWRISGTELIREIPSLPREERTRAYARGGVYLYQDKSNQSYCRIDLSPGFDCSA